MLNSSFIYDLNVAPINTTVKYNNPIHFYMFVDAQKSTTIALKGKHYWKITDNGVMDGYPKKVNSYWKNLPANLDAAVYSRATRRTYFFKGISYKHLFQC